MDRLARRRFRQGLLCRPGGRVAHAASRHRAHAHRAGACSTGSRRSRARRSWPATSRSAPWARPPAGSGLALMRHRPRRRCARGRHAADRRRPRHPHRRAGRASHRAEADRRMTRAARLHADGLTRCPWPGEDPLYVAYHDTEWGVPEYDDRALYEKLILDGFQAGLSWITILRKRDNFRKAFDDFEPEKIARYNAKKIHALMNDAGIVRNRAKIEGTIASAKSYLEDHGRRPWLLEASCGTSSTASRRSISSRPPRACRPRRRCRSRCRRSLSARGFKFVGPTIVYAFMQATGMVNDHLVTCFCHDSCAASRSAARASKPNDGEETRPPTDTARLAADAVGPAARPARSLAARHRDRRHRPRPGARRALERPDQRRAHLLGRAAHAAGRGRDARSRCRASIARLRLAALLHDAPEYVIGDMISPFKAVIGGDYKAVEKRLLAAIHIRFGLPPVLPAEIDAADQGRRPRRGLSRGDAARGLLRKPRRGACSAAIPACPTATRADYLTPWTRGQGREAVSGAVQDACRLERRR